MRAVFLRLIFLFALLPAFLQAYPYLYTASSSNSSRPNVFDIANPANPVPISYTSALTNAGLSVAISANGQYLYNSNQYAGTLSVWNIINPGNPSFVQTVSGNTQPWGVLLHPSGQYLYLGDGITSNITIYTLIDQENPIPTVVSVPQRVNSLTFSPNGDYLYTVGSGANQLQTFDISNPINPVLQSTIGIQAANLAIHPTGQYLYVLDSLNLQLAVFDLSSPGSPVRLPQNLPIGTNPQVVIVSPSQKYLYATNYADNTLSIFNIENPSTPIAEPTFSSSFNGPAALITSPNGSYLYVANTGNNTISVVDISAEASPVWVRNVSATFQPIDMAINPLFSLPFSRPMTK